MIEFFSIIILMYICICNAVTERQVRATVDAGATTLSDLQFELGVATCCGACAGTASEYLPGGRCSNVCHIRSDAVAPNAQPDGVAVTEAKVNGFPLPLVAAI